MRDAKPITQPNYLVGAGLVTHEDGRPIREVPYRLEIAGDERFPDHSFRRIRGYVDGFAKEEIGALQGVPLILYLEDGRRWRFHLADRTTGVSRVQGLLPALQGR